MNIPSGYRADNPQGMYVKNRQRRLHRNNPVKEDKECKAIYDPEEGGKDGSTACGP